MAHGSESAMCSQIPQSRQPHANVLVFQRIVTSCARGATRQREVNVIRKVERTRACAVVTIKANHPCQPDSHWHWPSGRPEPPRLGKGKVQQYASDQKQSLLAG